MPIPLIVWAIAAGIAAIAAGTGITFACLSGQKVAFIGMKGSGKTTAVQAFKAIKEGNKDWKANNDTSGTLSNSEEQDVLDFKVCIDTSGAQELKRHWETTISSVDRVFYFFDISRLDEIVNEDDVPHRYRQLVKADLYDIAAICQKKDKKILVMATHTDVPHEREKAERYCADIMQPLKEFKFVKGSLKDYKSALELFNKTKEMLK